jgi:phenylacetate-CoA ligase
MTSPESSERASLDEIRALQLDRLRWSVRHAYQNVAHYGRTFDACGVHPDDLRKLEDVAKFPFLSKQDFRDNYPFGLFAVPREKVVRVHASSGTTGRPTVVGYTAKDVDTWADLVARSIRAAGGHPGQIVHIAYGYGLFTGGLGAHYGAERLGCTVIPMSGGQTERQAQLIRDFRPDIIMVTPSYALNIAEELTRQGCRDLGGSFLPGNHRPGHWQGVCRRRRASDLAHSVKAYIGISVSVEVHPPGTMERSVGKAKRLIDRRG